MNKIMESSSKSFLTIFCLIFFFILNPNLLQAENVSCSTKNIPGCVNPEVLKSVTFCRPNNMVSALLYVADSKGFFREQGLMPKFETTTNAKLCNDMLLARGADYMAGADGPWTYLAASNPPLRILANLQKNPETAIFARRDRSIGNFKDLKGKLVAYLPGTISYFFLARVLRHHGLTLKDLRLTSMQPPTMPTALIGGAIDAFCMWEPWGSLAEKELKDNYLQITATDLYQYESLLTGHKDAMASEPEVPKLILKALLQAEKFIAENNNEAFEILKKSIVFEEKAFKRLWPQYTHKVLLEKGPVDLMTENFKLLKEDDINFKDHSIPDFNSFVDSKPLLAIAPERVKL